MIKYSFLNFSPQIDNSLSFNSFRENGAFIQIIVSKIITFFDLCGHEKYLKTTILGLTSQFPDLTFILVGGNMGITKITKEQDG